MQKQSAVDHRQRVVLYNVFVLFRVDSVTNLCSLVIFAILARKSIVCDAV